jgi:hypothetical protein
MAVYNRGEMCFVTTLPEFAGQLQANKRRTGRGTPENPIPVLIETQTTPELAVDLKDLRVLNPNLIIVSFSFATIDDAFRRVSLKDAIERVALLGCYASSNPDSKDNHVNDPDSPYFPLNLVEKATSELDAIRDETGVMMDYVFNELHEPVNLLGAKSNLTLVDFSSTMLDPFQQLAEFFYRGIMVVGNLGINADNMLVRKALAKRTNPTTLKRVPLLREEK